MVIQFSQTSENKNGLVLLQLSQLSCESPMFNVIKMTKEKCITYHPHFNPKLS